MAENSPAGSEDPNDPVLNRLSQAVEELIQFNPQELATQINDDLKRYIAGLTPNKPDPYDPSGAAKDIATKKALAGFTLTKQLSQNNSDSTYNVAVAQAQLVYGQARDAWLAAVSAYKVARTNANLQFTSDVTNEVESYKHNSNQDSKSRDQMLYQSMMQQVGTSLQTSTGATEAAGATLATAAGAAIAAFAAYVAAVETATANKITGDAALLQTYWSSVEGLLDANT